MMTPGHALLDIAPEVAQALDGGQAVVSLESTIVAHGMPWPDNLAAARAVQAEVRAHGAVPATIAILGGRLKAGLSDSQLEQLARGGAAVPKASRRDLAALVSAGRDGATTVASTMIIAALAGIRVFATGGIGGVHRGAAQSMDVSADLTELARTPVAVVCAGAKAILDLPLTLEVLETHGVPVLGYGTDRFPAFWCRDSGLPVDARCDTPDAVAALLRAHWALGLGSGVVVANPIPQAHALPRDQVEAAIAAALADASAAGITGKAVTPYLLQRMVQITGGHSLRANVELVLDNARVAAGIARAWAAARTPG
ncbi:MAG: pseudouridine-5'-phosphate glycosidase [Aquabacterium sp.]